MITTFMTRSFLRLFAWINDFWPLLYNQTKRVVLREELSRELDLDRKRLGELRQQIQTNLYDTLPGEVMTGTACLCR
jgi:hypothetical protein